MTPGEASARPATVDDLAAIEELMAEARAEAETKRGGTLLVGGELSKEPDLLRSALSEPNDAIEVAVIVGLYAESVVGVSMVHFEEREAGRMARLTIFFVHSDGREVAIGEAMMNKVQALARERGCQGLDAYALPGDRNTKNFFESFGLKARLLVVTTEL